MHYPLNFICSNYLGNMKQGFQRTTDLRLGMSNRVHVLCKLVLEIPLCFVI